MSRFNYLNHDEHAQTIDIGAGLRWNDVFGYLNPKGYTVVGGRVNDVGVAGFILGGGTLLILSSTTCFGLMRWHFQDFHGLRMKED